MHDQNQLTIQYADDGNLQTRIRTHKLYTVGPGIEDAVDVALNLHQLEDHVASRMVEEGGWHAIRVVLAAPFHGESQRCKVRNCGFDIVNTQGQVVKFHAPSLPVNTRPHQRCRPYQRKQDQQMPLFRTALLLCQ
ncbi:MAG: hypothetical protein IVW51_06965 [Thermaceae bacterium]|nr:hypothetical protein [Thermaceae bacterium]